MTGSRIWKCLAATALLAAVSPAIIPLVRHLDPGPRPDTSSWTKIYRCRNGRWSTIPAPPDGTGRLEVSPEGVVWSVSPKQDGISRWDGARWAHFEGANFGGARRSHPLDLAFAGHEIWGAFPEGVARFDGSRWTLYPEAVKTRTAMWIAAGSSGVWAADEEGNLSHFDGASWSIEDLTQTPVGADWSRRMEDHALELRVTSDGALWLLLGSLWRKEAAGWREIRQIGGDSSEATMVGQSGDRVWLLTDDVIWESGPTDSLGGATTVRRIPIEQSWTLLQVLPSNGDIWVATMKGLFRFDGRYWQPSQMPSGGMLLRSSALGPDGSIWIVGNSHSTLRVALWAAPGMAACLGGLALIGFLLMVWAKAMAGAWALPVDGISKEPRRELPWKIAGWAFFGVALFLICSHFLAERLLRSEANARALFPTSFAMQAFFQAFVLFGLLAGAGLLTITGWGVYHKRGWARWTGLGPCAYLFMGFPSLTAVSLAGVYVLWKYPARPNRRLTGAEFWDPRRNSGWLLIFSYAGWLIGRYAANAFEYARGVTMPTAAVGPSLLVVLLLLWTHAAIHEMGHALAARMVGFEIKAVAIGPLLFRKEDGRFRLQFAWKGLQLVAGYVGAVPRNALELRSKEAAVTAGGPLASFGAGALLLGIAWLLPATPTYTWHVLVTSAVLGFYIGVMNLMPFGYTDGTRLLHLLLRTRRGEQLLEKTCRMLDQEQITQHVRLGDCDKCVELHHAILNRSLAAGDADPARTASDFLNLGLYELMADQYLDAEVHLRAGLDRITPGSNASLECFGWHCLLAVYTRRHMTASAHHAYTEALAASERLRTLSRGNEDRLRIDLGVADLHSRQFHHHEVLAVVDCALRDFPTDPAHPVRRGELLSLRALAELQLGHADAGLLAAGEAAAIFRSATGPGAGDLDRLKHLGQLGWRLWEGGQSALAADIVREAIGLLEGCGARQLITEYRLAFSAQLEADGRPDEAEAELPAYDDLTLRQRCSYLACRGAIRLRTGHADQARADFEARLQLVLEDVPADEVVVAMAKSSLADAYLDLGDLTQAEALVTEAHQVFVPLQHPESVSTWVTMALLAHRRTQNAEPSLDEALRGWNEVPLVSHAAKARYLATAAGRLEAAGLPDHALRFREAARIHKDCLSKPCQDDDTQIGTPNALAV